LSLFLEAEDVSRFIWYLHRNAGMNGYYKAEAQSFFGHARVFHKLMSNHLPDLNAHLEKLGILDENTNMYCVKWFSGLGVHFLPFSVVFDYMEAVLQHGVHFCFKFGIAYLEHIRPQLMSCTNVSTANAMLKNEHPTRWAANPTLWSNDVEKEAAAFQEVIAKAHGVDLDQHGDFEKMLIEIPQEFATIMAERKARGKALAEDVSDIEFSDEQDDG